MEKQKFRTLKKDLNLLITDRYPIEFFDRVKISLENDNVIATDNYDIQTIPVETTFLLFLGNGCSITTKAMERCMKAGCSVVAGNAGVKVHTVWGGNRWLEPKSMINQVKKVIDFEKKLKIAKIFTTIRLIRDNKIDYLDKVKKASSIEEILGYEATACKETYKNQAQKLNFKFKRVFEDKNNSEINERLNILNNCLYSYITGIIIAYGLNPSIGFCHGINRRGGLSFDIADIFKLDYSIIPSFSDYKKTNRELMIQLSNKLQERNCMFIKQVLELCKLISSDLIDVNQIDLDLIFKDLKNEFDYRGFFNW